MINEQTIAALKLRAGQHYDLSTGEVRRDERTRPLTEHERRWMLDWIAAHEDPIDASRSDVYLSGMFLGAVARRERWLATERKLAEMRAVVEAATVKADAARERAELARVQKELQAKRDYAQGLADGEAFAAAKKEADESIAEVRRALRVTRPRKQTEDDIRENAERERAKKWKKS